jgi:hypothetical protein
MFVNFYLKLLTHNNIVYYPNVFGIINSGSAWRDDVVIKGGMALLMQFFLLIAGRYVTFRETLLPL